MINRIDLELEAVERDREDVLEERAEQEPVSVEIDRLKDEGKLEDVLKLLDKFLGVDNYE